jgi:hypothetical protein
MGDFQSTLDKFFPGAIPAAQFLRQSYDALRKHAFTRDNTFAGVGLCRDELTRPLFHEIEKMWGEVFNISSLAGMLLLGKAGFQASLHHAPHEEGLPRHVYYALPHIGMNSSEEIGYCYRPGQKQASTACGALMVFLPRRSNCNLSRSHCT